MEVLIERYRICHAKKKVIARMIEITARGLRRVHSNIVLKEKCLGVPDRIIQPVSLSDKGRKISKEKKD